MFTQAVAECLVDRGHDVTLFASSVGGRPARETRGGIEIVRRGGRLGVYREARRFWKEQPPNRYDVVVDEINTRPFMTPRWVSGTPVVALIHQLAREIWFYETRFPVSVIGRYVLEPWWLRAYRRVPAITVSASSARSLTEHHGWGDVTVVAEGWSPHPVPAVEKEDVPTVAYLGRLVEMKRPRDALHAFRVLAESEPSARLWIIGDGPLRDSLREEASPSVELLGRLTYDDLMERLARAHVLISTSIREGWGLNVSEAAACGTPAIGYSVPGLVDSILASGGALVPESPAMLGTALVDFFQGRLALEPKISTVPWPEVAAQVEEQLTQVVRGR